MPKGNLTNRTPETLEDILKFGHYLISLNFADAETQTDEENIKDYYKVNNQIRINILDLDFHNIGKLNSEVRIETDDFFCPPRTEIVDGEEIARGKVDCEGIICYGSSDELSMLRKYQGKDTTFAFDTWKVVDLYGRKWLHVYYTASWKLKQVADVLTETDLSMADISEMEANQKSLYNFISKNFFLRKRQQRKSVDFKLQIIERGIASLEEDKKHATTQGRAMKRKLEELEDKKEKYKKQLDAEKTKNAKEKKAKEDEINNLTTQLKSMEEKVKELELNDTEKQLLIYTKWMDWDLDDYEKVKGELETGKTPYAQWDWNDLRADFSSVRNKLLELINAFIDQKKLLEGEINLSKTIEAELGTKVEELQELLKRKESEYQKNLKVKDDKFKEIETKLARIKQKAHDRKVDIVGLEARKVELKADVDNKANEIIGLKERYQKELDDKIKEINEVNANLKEAKEKIETHKEELCKFEALFKILEEKKAEIVFEEEQKLVKEMGELIDSLAYISVFGYSSRYSINDDDSSDSSEDWDTVELEKKIHELTQEKEQLEEEVEAHLEAIDVAAKAFRGKSEQDLIDEIKGLKEENGNYKGELEVYKQRRLSDENKTLKVKVEELTKQVSKLNLENGTLKSSWTTLKSQISQLDIQIEKIEERHEAKIETPLPN